MYDQEGIQGLTSRGGGHSHGMDAADIFAQFFDANNDGPGVFFDFAGGGSSRRKTKGQDSVLPYDVTLEDLYNGKVFKVNLEKEAICSTCKGYVYSSIAFGSFSQSIALARAAMLNQNRVSNVIPKAGFTQIPRSVIRLSVSPERCAMNVQGLEKSYAKRTGADLHVICQ